MDPEDLVDTAIQRGLLVPNGQTATGETRYRVASAETLTAYAELYGTEDEYLRFAIYLAASSK